jgi:2'-5' RNA ligase
MQTTSHFIGVSLESSKFTDLFVDLQKYFRGHDLEGAIELQNILSLHITLYYLERSLAEDEKTQLLQDASDMSLDVAMSISGLKGSYFGESGKERVCYLGCAGNEKFKEMNQFFTEKYRYSQISENQGRASDRSRLFDKRRAFVPSEFFVPSRGPNRYLMSVVRLSPSIVRSVLILSAYPKPRNSNPSF